MEYIKSKKYTGISTRTTDNDTIFYCSYKTKMGNYSRFKLGYRSAGMTEKIAYELLQQRKQNILTGDITTHQKQSISLTTAGELYFKDLELRMTSDFRNSYNKFKRHILPYFGKHTDIRDITSTQIHEYKLEKLKTLAPATVAMQVSIISSCYNYLRKHQKMQIENPALGIESTIHVDNARERYLTIEEIHLLLTVLKENRYKNKPHIARVLLLFVKFALSTGARASAILNIKRGNIDFKTRTVQIFDTKNKSWYTAYMSSKLFEEEDYIFIEGFKNGDYIFWNDNRQLTHRIVAYHTRPIYNELFNEGVAEDDYKNRVCNHTLRHTFASHLAINQVPIYEIKKLMNHRDIKMTLRYMKLSEANKVSAVEGIY